MTTKAARKNRILGIVNSMLHPLTAVLATILGHKARKETVGDRHTERNGIATAGLALDRVGMASLLLIVLVFVMIAFTAFMSGEKGWLG